MEIYIQDVSGPFHGFIRRSPAMPFLLGYIEVPAGHPWHGCDYDNIDATAHGGLTYAGRAEDFNERCGERMEYVYSASAGSWVVGFDCGHAGDEVPGYIQGARRDTAYVRSEIESLREQARAASPPADVDPPHPPAAPRVR